MAFVASVDRYTKQKVDFQSFPLAAAAAAAEKHFNDRFMNSNTAITRVLFKLNAILIREVFVCSHLEWMFVICLHC